LSFLGFQKPRFSSNHVLQSAISRAPLTRNVEERWQQAR